MSESVAAAAKELGPDVVRVVKIDTDAYPDLASRFRVSALPTLVLFRGGSPVDRVEGYRTPQALADRVRYYCKSLDLKFGRR
jgi:thioredoxin-like negative regulator of GroEL